MPLEPRTPSFRPGETITTDRLNGWRAEQAQLARYFAENFRLPSNPRTGLPAFCRHFMAIVQSGPPGGGSDYTDARYYLTAAAPTVTLSTGDLFTAAVESTPGLPINITATNLAEMPLFGGSGSGSHNVPANTTVHVFGFRTRDRSGGAGGIWQYVFFHESLVGQTFRVSLNQNGGMNGTATSGSAATVATYTYDVHTLGGKQIGTALAPEAPRWMAGPVTAATLGLAYWSGSAYVLMVAYESMGGKVCASS